MESSYKEIPLLTIQRIDHRSSFYRIDYALKDSQDNENQNEGGLHQSRINSINNESEMSIHIQGSEDNDSLNQHNSLAVPMMSKKNRYSIASTASEVVGQLREKKEARKVKEFDVEKLKPFFIQFEDPVQEITELEVCNNILLFIMIISGLSMVFIFGIGIAKFTSFNS